MTSRPLETIVVDSYSTDDTKKVKEQYPIRFVSIREKSMVKARNVGYTLAQGDIVAFLDDDVMVHPQWSEYLLKAYETAQIGGVGGRVIPYDTPRNSYQKVKTTSVGKVFRTGLVVGNYDMPLDSPVTVDSLIGCNMSFRKEVMKKVGSFDENYAGNCFRDDTDYCLRVKKEGYKLLYQPKALVWHKFRGKTVNADWVYWYTRNNTYFYFKNIFGDSRLHFILFIYRMFLPPRDYKLKSGIKVKPELKVLPLALKGMLDGLNVYRHANPSYVHARNEAF